MSGTNRQLDYVPDGWLLANWLNHCDYLEERFRVEYPETALIWRMRAKAVREKHGEGHNQDSDGGG